jgi:hypothetical protein
MDDTMLTFHGWVGGNVRNGTHKDVSVATIRVGVTPRIKRDAEWEAGETLWYSVTAWRTLADHVSMSVRKGDAVVFDLGEWRSTMASRKNDDGTISFITSSPDIFGLDFVVSERDGKRALVTRAAQQEYVFVER